MSKGEDLGVWFPTVRTGTGTDVFTERLADGLRRRGLRAEITWLPLRAEFAPWSVSVPTCPPWATVAHVNSWMHGRFLPLHLPFVATLHHSIHDPALRQYKGWMRRAYHYAWIAPIERRVLRRAAAVIAVSQFVADSAATRLVDVPISVIYNGVDTSRFRPVSGPRSSRTAFRLLYIGSWMKRKGVDLLAPIMRTLGEGYELIYTGCGRADRHSMPGNTHDVGRLRDDAVIHAMQDADALLFPSRSEGLPLVAIEAMACGLPVIACAASSMSEVVETGVTGMLARVDDVQGLAAAVRQLSADPARRARMGFEARQAAETRFAASEMVDAYVTMYQRVASDQPR